jgi:hypothetical protein
MKKIFLPLFLSCSLLSYSKEETHLSFFIQFQSFYDFSDASSVLNNDFERLGDPYSIVEELASNQYSASTNGGANPQLSPIVDLVRKVVFAKSASSRDVSFKISNAYRAMNRRISQKVVSRCVKQIMKKQCRPSGME